MSNLVATFVSSRSLLIKGRFLWVVLKKSKRSRLQEVAGSNFWQLTGQVCLAESVSVVSCLTDWLVRWAHLAVGGIATGLEELKYLFRPGTGSRAHGPWRSESLNSVGLLGRPKAGVAQTGPGRQEVHLKTGVAQRWG